MESLAKVKAERDKFLEVIRDDAEKNQDTDSEVEAIYSTLQWVLGEGSAPSEMYLE